MRAALLWVVRTWRRLAAPGRRLARLIFPVHAQRRGTAVALYTAEEPIAIPSDIHERARALVVETRLRFESGDHFDPLLRAAQSGAEVRAELREDYNGQSAPHILIAIPCPPPTCAEDTPGSMTNSMKKTPASSRDNS